MLTSITAVLLGLVILVWSADRFIFGAAALARNLGIPTMIIGLTIVGFGTSAPELLVSGIAAWQGNSGLAIGNAVGSNIANIGLILGMTALIAPLAITSATLRKEMPLVLGVSVLAYLLVLNGTLGRMDGLILLGGLILVMAWMVRDGLKGRNNGPDPIQGEFEAEIPRAVSTGRAVLWLLIGLVLLLISARALVWGAVNIATALGVSDLVIGLTIVAIGTSLPELAAALMSARRNEPDLVLGNILGSNLFNLLGVLAIPGLIRPAGVPADALWRDFPVMLGLTLLIIVMAFSFRGRPRRINRVEGGVLLALFIGYMTWVYLSLSPAGGAA